MSNPNNVVYLHKSPREIAQFLRVGHSEHRRCEHLLSAGKLAAKRFVIGAGYFERQADLIRDLKDAGRELILDTNVDELSVPGRFASSVRSAPWATLDRPLDKDDFRAGTNRSVIEPIADFTLQHEFDVVMSPTHFLGGDQEDWLEVDIAACTALRHRLDQIGGQHTPIDYPLLISYRQLRSPEFRQKVIQQLADAPYDFLWLRVSGFGANQSGAGIARYIEAVRDFSQLGRPLIADHLGGLASLAVPAFGASSGFAHGLEGKERFDTGGWYKPGSSGGGQSKKVYVAGLDRRIPVEEMRTLFDEARTSRQIFGCSDKTCCGDIETMLNHPEAHAMVQKNRQVSALSSVPETLRTDRFLSDQLEDAERKAKRALRLKNSSDETKKKIIEAGQRLERIGQALQNLHERRGHMDFAVEAKLRRRGSGGAGGVERNQP